jgi:hypothetical protein
MGLKAAAAAAAATATTTTTTTVKMGSAGMLKTLQDRQTHQQLVGCGF